MLATVAEDEISGAVPPAFVLRSSPPAPAALTEEVNGMVADVEDENAEPLQNGTTNLTEEYGLLGGMIGGDQTFAAAQQDLSMDDVSAPAVPTIGLEATPIEDAMRKAQAEMESSYTLF